MSKPATHLGENAAAVADCQLGHADRDSALVHTMWCADCRTLVADQRTVKAALTGLPVPEVSTALLARLSALPSLSSAEMFGLVRSPMPTPAPGRPREQPHRVNVRRRRLSAALAGSASVIALGVWAAPTPEPARIPYDLVNAGGQPATYTTVGYERLRGATQLRQLSGYGLLTRP